MDATAARRRRFSFGSFVLDEWAAELRKDGIAIPLNATPMRFLQFLLEEHERVISKEEVLERVWPGSSVSDASLASALKEIRQALGDDGARQEWIRTLRNVGYRFMGEVRVEHMAVTAPVAPSEIQALPAPSGRLFVGREAQLHALDLRWRELATSGAQLALLTGPAGIGKTRLALEFESIVRARGGRALFAWCYEGQGAPPYWPWSLLLDAYLRSTPAAESVLGRDRDLLGPLLGARGGASQTDGCHTWSPEDEFRFFYAVAGFFRRAAVGRPLLATIDDIQWSGRSSLRLLSFLVRELYDAPILFVATARDHAPGATPLSDVAGALRHPRALQLAIPVLDERDGARLVKGTLDEDLDPRLIAVLAKRSQGNPLFLSELVSVLQSNPFLRDPEHVHRLVPQGIQDLIMSRIAALSPDSQDLVQFVSMIGHEVSTTLLSHAKLANVGQALSEALTAGILIALRDDRRLFQVHPLTAEVVRETLSPDRALELHRCAVAAFERTHVDDLDPVAAELASHYAALARAGGSPEPAVYHATRAGDIAISRLSYDEAADHFRLGIDCLKLGSNHDRQTECELLTRAGDALKRAGRGQESWQAYTRAIGLARQYHLPELFAEAVLGLAPGFFASAGSEDVSGRLESPNYDPDLVALLMEALEHLPPESQRLRSLLLSRCAIAKIGGAPEEERARLSQEALDLARNVGDRAALSYAVTARHSTLCRAQDFEHRRDLVEAILARSSSIRDPELFLIERIYTLSVMLEIGDLSGVDREVASCIQHARALRLPRSLRHAYSFHAMRLCITGQFEAACEQLNRLIAEAEKENDPSHLLQLRLRLAYAEHEIFRRPDTEAALQAAIRIYPQMRYFRAALAKFYLDAGDPQRARLEVDQIVRRGLIGIPYNEGWPVTIALLSEIAGALSDKDLCEELYNLLAPASGRFIVPVFSASLWASADRLLGCLAHVRGERRAAVSHFERALELETRTGADPLKARTLYHFGLTLARDGDEGDRPRDLIAQSKAIADKLRMRPLLSQIEDASREFPKIV